MEKTGRLNYLKGIILTLLVLYTLFVFQNFLKGIWDWSFYFGDGEWDYLLRFANYTGISYLVVYGLIQIMDLVFTLALNRLVKKQGIGKGYHFLIILLSFLPVVNLFLLYIIKRRLNKQLFTYSGMNGVKSDRKIVAIWILTLFLVVYILVLTPFLTLYVNTPELVSGAGYSHTSIVVTDCCFVATSFTWFLYYLEFKRVLYKIDLDRRSIHDNQLLDS